jgi:hypothetical protein
VVKGSHFEEAHAVVYSGTLCHCVMVLLVSASIVLCTVFNAMSVLVLIVSVVFIVSILFDAK